MSNDDQQTTTIKAKTSSRGFLKQQNKMLMTFHGSWFDSYGLTDYLKGIADIINKISAGQYTPRLEYSRGQSCTRLQFFNVFFNVLGHIRRFMLCQNA